MGRSTDTRHPADINPAYRLAARTGARPDSVVSVSLPGGGEVSFGGTGVVVMAGPCAVEGREQVAATAHALRLLGVRMLRGGAFKPRTSPYSFQGLGEEGLKQLRETGDRFGMAVVTEVLTPEEVPLVARYADVLQVGTRNMANYRLLETLGRCGKPVLLKRGMAATIEEFLCAAEYVLAGGNPDVILCERGVRGFEPLARNAFDLNAVAILREMTHLPVVVDPSHAAGRADIVPAISMGAVAAGAQGLLVEAHHDPAAAIVDGDQSLDIPAVADLLNGVEAVARATGRTLAGGASDPAAGDRVASMGKSHVA